MANRITMNGDYPKIEKSNQWLDRAEGLIPAYAQTLAKGPTQHIRGVAPVFLESGKGAHVTDVDGNEYIDYTMGVGPLSLGYAYPAVDEAIAEQLKSGIVFSLIHPLEVELSEIIRDILPNAESVRFSKTGADVTSAAVRVARAFTGREKVLCCGYHGWHDWYIGITSRNLGVPEGARSLVHTFQYNDINSVAEAMDEDTACVILEPMVFQMPKEGFLQELKELCERNGTLLIFDEMWTGFRIALGGGQEAFNVVPDLACYSKAIANGMPLSVLSGRKDVMHLLQDDVFFFTTFGGEALSLAAAKATIKEMQQKPVLQTIRQTGDNIADQYRALVAELGAGEITSITGHPARTMVTFDPSAGDGLKLKSLMQQELIKRGILWSGFHNVSYAHSEADVQHTLAAYREVLPIIQEAVANNSVDDHLRGEPVQAVFRKVSDFNLKPKAGK